MSETDPAVAAPAASPDGAERSGQIRGRAPLSERERRELTEAAHAFESLFTQMLVKQMRESQLDEGFFGEASGSQIYEGLFEQHLAQQISGDSPLGIADLLLDQWTGGADAVGAAHRALDTLEALRAGRAYENVIGGAQVPLPAADEKVDE